MEKYKPDYLKRLEKSWILFGDEFKPPSDIMEQGLKDTFINYEAKIARKCLEEVISGYYRSHYKRLVEEGVYNDKFPLLKEVLETRQQLQEHLDKSDSNYVFITVNPPETVDLKMFVKTVEKAMRKTWIMKYCYVFEQRFPSEKHSTLGQGKHCHILVYRNDKKYSHLVREFKNTFKGIVDVHNTALLNFKCIKDIDYEKVMNYMKGMKNDEGKHEKQMNDKKFRELNHLQDYYEM